MKKVWIILSLLLGLSFASTFSEKGNAAYNQGKIQESLLFYKQAIDAGEDLALNHFYLGNALYKLNQVGRALSAYEKSIELAPKFSRAYVNAAGVYLYLKEYAKSIEYYHKAQELDPKNPTLYKMLGECYLSLKDPAKAAEMYELGKRLDPENISWDLALIDMYVELEDYDAVEIPLKQAIAKSPERTDLKMYLADLYVVLEKSDKAIDAYQSILTEDSKNVVAYTKLANRYEQDKNYFLAVATLKQAEKNLDNSHEIESDIGRLYQLIGDYNNSIAYFKKAASRGEEKARNYLMKMGHDLLASGDIQSAVSVFKDVIKFYPGDFEAADILKDIAS